MDEPAKNVVSIGTMFKAFNILSEHGHERFRQYVTACDMSVEDIERCLNKHLYVTDQEFRVSIDHKIKYIRDKWRVEIKPWEK